MNNIPPSKIVRKKTRQSNIELLRCISMFFVLMLHVNYVCVGDVQYSDLVNNPLNASTRMFLEHLSIVAVNVFVLISGWFSIHPTWKSVSNLLFQVMFFSFLLLGWQILFYDVPSTLNMFLSLYPRGTLWFIPAYLGLMVLAPILNSFAEHASRRQFLMVLFSFFTFQLFYGLLKDLAHFHYGYSTFSFVGIYLLARYMYLYPIRWFSNKSFIDFVVLYVKTMALNTTLHALSIYIGIPGDKVFGIVYNAPLVILGSVFLLLAFTRISIQSRIVNAAGKSCFAIYLIHVNMYVAPFYIAFYKNIYDEYSGLIYMLFVFITLCIVGIVCILIDKIRIYCWNKVYPLLEEGVSKIQSPCFVSDFHE